ncbi:hypothetical protein DYST_02279 [Dyella terrae]|nr:hypothetical protein DYST_02279 [Dyella terrae]
MQAWIIRAVGDGGLANRCGVLLATIVVQRLDGTNNGIHALRPMGEEGAHRVGGIAETPLFTQQIHQQEGRRVVVVMIRQPRTQE